MIRYARLREPFNVRYAIGDSTKFDIIGYARSYVYNHAYNVTIDTVHRGIIRRVEDNVR